MQPPMPDTQDAFRHLFILETPTHDPENVKQQLGLRLATTLRHGLKIFPNAPHGYYLVEDDRTAGQFDVFAFFQGQDAVQALQHLRLSRQQESSSTPTLEEQRSSQQTKCATSAPSEPSSMSRPSRSGTGFRHATPNHAATSHSQVVSSGPAKHITTSGSINPSAASTTGTPAPASQITPTDRNTLIPLSQIARARDSSTASLYAMRVKIDPALEPGASSSDYILPIDTAGNNVWFYEKDFKRLVDADKGPVASDDLSADVGTGPLVDEEGIPYSDEDEDEDDTDSDSSSAPPHTIQPWDSSSRLPAHRCANKKPVVPPYPGAEASRVSGRVKYLDGSKVLLHRYPRGTEIQAFVPCWDWGRERVATTELPLPRVLAYAANDVIVQSPFDGNLGLALPRATMPFDRFEPSTFHDAIVNERHVDLPNHMTIRLLHPEVVAAGCPMNVQSYVYYGEYWPCAAQESTGAGASTSTPSDQKLVPSFTPKIRVIPTSHAIIPWRPLLGLPSDPKVYTLWTVRFICMTFLVPIVPRASRQAPVPWREMTEWTRHHPIYLPHLGMDFTDVMEDERSAAGLPVTLDTCTAFSVLPDTVCQTIGREWLGLSEEDMGPPPSRTKTSDVSLMNLYCPDGLDLDDHDILFTFQGEGDPTNMVEFRCTASRFLRSVWREPLNRGFTVPIVAQPVDYVHSVNWILAQNFFWTAFVRLDCDFRRHIPLQGPDTDVYVRLAPQRVKGAAGNVLDERALGFHKLPGRLEDRRSGSGQASLRYDD